MVYLVSERGTSLITRDKGLNLENKYPVSIYGCDS